MIRAAINRKSAAPRMRKCRNQACRAPFLPARSGEVVCGPDCALVLAKTNRLAMERKKLKADKDKAKTMPELKALCQQAFNGWVRARDADLPCISCGRMHQGQWHAGHYLSVGSHPNLRYDERNVHRQCQPCNMHLHGNLLNFRSGLIERKGLEFVEALESDKIARSYSRADLVAMAKTFRAMTRELLK